MALDGRYLKQDRLDGKTLEKVRALKKLAEARGQKLAQLALQWVLRDPAVTSALIGASRPEQIRENVQALSAPPLTAEELEKIDRITGWAADPQKD